MLNLKVSAPKTRPGINERPVIALLCRYQAARRNLAEAEQARNPFLQSWSSYFLNVLLWVYCKYKLTKKT